MHKLKIWFTIQLCYINRWCFLHHTEIFKIIYALQWHFFTCTQTFSSLVFPVIRIFHQRYFINYSSPVQSMVSNSFIYLLLLKHCYMCKYSILRRFSLFCFLLFNNVYTLFDMFWCSRGKEWAAFTQITANLSFYWFFFSFHFDSRLTFHPR